MSGQREQAIVAANGTGPAAGVGLPSLEIHGRDGSRRRVPLNGGRAVIGRSPDADVRIENDTVSRRHAEVFRDPFGRWVLHDLGGRNGVKLDGRRVDDCVLGPGVEPRLGDFHVRLVPVSQEAEVPGNEVTFADDDAGVDVHTFDPGEVGPAVTQEQLAELLTLGQELLETADGAHRRDVLCRRLTGPAVGGWSAQVLRAGEMGRAPQRLAFASGVGTDADAQATYVSRGLLRRVVESQRAALASNAPVGPVDTEITIEREDLALSAVGCPLGHSGAGSDVLYVTLPPRYGTREWLSLVTLAARLYQQAESTWANRRLAENNAVVERELAQAAEIQSRLIPDVRQRDRIDVGIGFRACRWVAGDYLDVRRMADGRELLVVADVCGKGMQAALVARAVHTIVHVSGARPIRLVDLMDDLNNYLVQYLPPWSFVTAAAVALDPATGDLECVCAGHPAPLVVTADGRTVALQEGAHLPLGMGPIEWTPQRSTLPPGAWLALYTDGVTEMRQEDGEMLGTEAWERMLSAVIASTTPGTAAAQVALALEERLDAAQGRALSQDDRTYLVVRRRDGKHAN